MPTQKSNPKKSNPKKSKSQKSIRTRIVVFLVAIHLLLFFSIASAYVFTYAKESNKRVSSLLDGFSSSFMHSLNILLSYGLRLNELHGMNERCSQFAKNNLGVEHCAILDNSGVVIYHSAIGRVGKEYCKEHQIDIRMLKRKSAVVREHSHLERKDEIILIAPIFSVDQKITGIFVLAYDAHIFKEEVNKTIAKGVLSLFALFLASCVSTFVYLNSRFIKPLILFSSLVDDPDLNSITLNTDDELQILADAYIKIRKETSLTTVSIDLLREAKNEVRHLYLR